MTGKGFPMPPNGWPIGRVEGLVYICLHDFAAEHVSEAFLMRHLGWWSDLPIDSYCGGAGMWLEPWLLTLWDGDGERERDHDCCHMKVGWCCFSPARDSRLSRPYTFWSLCRLTAGPWVQVCVCTVANQQWEDTRQRMCMVYCLRRGQRWQNSLQPWRNGSHSWIGYEKPGRPQPRQPGGLSFRCCKMWIGFGR